MFIQAKPIWLKDRENDMNVQAGFRTSFEAVDGRQYTLRITGSALYRILVNGNFVHYGPARGPHGYMRVDEINLTRHLSIGSNMLSVEVAGYNCYSYYTLKHPSFLQAEVCEDQDVLFATGDGGSFLAVALDIRVQKAMRYSFQRTFSEIYHLDLLDSLTHWTTSLAPCVEHQTLALSLQYLPREVPVPCYELSPAQRLIAIGNAEPIDHPEGFSYLQHRFIDQISDVISGYRVEEIEERPFEKLQDVAFTIESEHDVHWINGISDLTIAEGKFALIDMGLNNNGFIRTEMEAVEDSEVFVLFDEKLIDGNIDIHTWQSLNVIKLSLKKHEQPYSFESFESYGFRYLMCYVPAGSIKLISANLREYVYPNANNAIFHSNDPQLNAIYAAAVETYRQNTLDVFMDCPTRERAGWLCDSYFTAQSAQFFTGDAIVEKVMLENYVLAESFPSLPTGMLPMCYPGDQANGNFIPQWAMWYVIELEGYFKRNAEADLNTFKQVCYALVDYFKRFRNEDGLLENLEMWNFIEWSEANDWVQDVHYPTNMLYSKMLRLIGTWYEDGALLSEAEHIRMKVIELSFDGLFFIDNAIRTEDGTLRNTGNRSEVCQYFAFFFDIADSNDAKFSELKRNVLEVFGPNRKINQIMPDIAYANAFIGNYLRMEILLRWMKYGQILDEMKSYFYNMTLLTGTLWENDHIEGSLNHGFASFAGVVLIRCLLGVQEIDERRGTVTMHFDRSLHVPFASLRLGTPRGDIIVKRVSKDNENRIDYAVPEGYSIESK